MERTRAQNEWFLAIEEALGRRGDEPTSEASDAFSLANPARTEEILDAAGFADATFIDVHRPIYFGRDVADALEWVQGVTSTRESLVRLGPPSAERALGRLQQTLVRHAAADGVWFDARAWIVKARRG